MIDETEPTTQGGVKSPSRTAQYYKKYPEKAKANRENIQRKRIEKDKEIQALKDQLARIQSIIKKE
jgi:hypothetical protein